MEKKNVTSAQLILFIVVLLMGYGTSVITAAPNPQTPSFVGRYEGEEQTAQGRMTISVALRATNVAIVKRTFPNSTGVFRDRGRWELEGRNSNRVRLTMDSGETYEFTYRNDTLTGSRAASQWRRFANRLVLRRVDDEDTDVGVTDYREMSLSEEGTGEYAPFGRSRETLNQATLATTAGGRAELTFETNRRRTIRANGWVTQSTNDSMTIYLQMFDNSEVAGTATVTLRGNRGIRSLNISGTVNRRQFTLSFNGRDRDTNTPTGRRMTLRERGTGHVQFATGIREPLVYASLEVTEGEDVEITLRRANNNVLRFSGRVQRMGNGSMLVRLTSSGNADAGGTADVQYQEPGTIYSININGTIDRRRVTAEFRRDENARPLPDGGAVDLPINWTQTGSGRYELGRRAGIELNRVSVSVSRNEQATLEFRDRGGRTYVYTGTLISRDGNTLRISLTEFRDGLIARSVSGYADITHGRNVINAINITGRLANERFTVDFNR